MNEKQKQKLGKNYFKKFLRHMPLKKVYKQQFMAEEELNF